MSHASAVRKVMNDSELRSALDPAGGHTTTITTTNLTPNVGEMLSAVNNAQPLVITNAACVAGNAIVLTGRCTFLNVSNAPVELRAATDAAGNVTLLLRFTLLGATPGPDEWSFSTSFPSLPKLPDWKPYSDPTSVPLDGLELFDAAFVVVTEAQTDVTGVPLAAGINFVSKLRPGGLVGFIETLFGHTKPFTLSGPIHLPGPADKFAPLVPGAWPWDTAGPPPGICLHADLGIDQTLGEKMIFQGIGLRMYSPPSSDWLDRNPTYQPAAAYVGKLAIPSASVTATAVAPIISGADSLHLLVAFSGGSVANLASLVDAVGTTRLIDHMPPGVASGGDVLGDLELTNLGLELSARSPGPAVTYVSVTIGMPKLKWSVWPDHFTVESVFTTFEVTTPFRSPQWDVSVYGKVEVEGVPVDVVASSTDGFVVYARLAKALEIPLNQLVKTYAGETFSAPGDLTVDALSVAIAPTKYYSMALAMAGQPNNPWVIPLGPTPLTISDVVLSFTYPSTGSVSGTIGGSLGLGSIGTLYISYDVPGPFTLRGSVPQVKLSQILATLTDQPVGLPSGFDLDFVDSTALIQLQGDDYLFQFGTQVSGLGSFAMQVQETAGWGFAAGLDLSLGRPSSVPGLGAVAAFEEFFGLHTFLLVVSTFDATGFTFPDLAAFDNPQISAKSIALPSQSTGLVAGINVFAQWTLDTTSRQQLLKTLLGLPPTLAITLQIGQDPTQNCKLVVAHSTTINKLPLSCTFGGLLQSGEIGLFLTGSMPIEIQGQTQQFDVTLLFVENGAFLSGTMKSSTPIDFVAFNVAFKLANLTLEIGIDWEGIPSLGIMGTIEAGFESSIAVFFDSAHPAKSMVAGSLSDLSLKKVAHAIAGTDVREWDPILESIAVRGTHTFKIAGALAGDLDNLKLDRVAEAFAHEGKTKVASSTAQALLVTGTLGSIWYLTDLSGEYPRHYELYKHGDEIVVSLDAQLYCAPQDTAIGSNTFKEGFLVSGSLHLLGIKSESTIFIYPAVGIAIDSATDRIVIGTEELFVLESKDGQGGPNLSAATFAQPDHEVERYRKPHLFINGTVGILGVRQALFVDLNADGFEFELTGELLPGRQGSVNGSLTGSVKNTVNGLDDLKIDGKFAVAIGTIDLGPLGKVSINAGASCELRISVKGREMRASLDATITFRGDSRSVQFDLDVHTAALADLAGKLAEEFTPVLRGLFQDAATWAKAVADGAVAGVESVGEVLKEFFNLDAAAAAGVLKEAEWGAIEVARTLDETFQAGSVVVKEILADLDYAEHEISAAMTYVFKWGEALLDAAGLAAAAAAEDTLASLVGIEQGKVQMVVFNHTDHPLRIAWLRGGEITKGPDTDIPPGGAGLVAVFAVAGHRWEWAYLDDLATGDRYQLYIQKTGWGDRYCEFGFADHSADADNSNPEPFADGVARADWDGGPTATYSLLRAPRWLLPTGATATGDTMQPGQVLTPHRSIRSSNERYHLWYRRDSNNLLLHPAGSDIVKWQTPDSGVAGVCIMQTDGNLVVYDRRARAVWASDTHTPGSRLVVRDEGRAVIYGPDGKAVWSTDWVGNSGIPGHSGLPAKGNVMQPGEILIPDASIASPNGHHRLVYQADTNLVLYHDGNARWSINRQSGGAGICIMQTDGNLVVYAGNGHAVWASDTHTPGSRLVVQDDGNIVIYTPDGTAVWSTGLPQM